MTPERWVEVGRLFDGALELEPEKREEFLEARCNGDSELRAEVESLLSSLASAESFLEDSIAGNLQAPAARRRAGPYELIEEIGHGGMGVVYRAVRHDQGFERFVALKLVKRGMDSVFILRRFEAERRILAGLDHPNIGKLFDGGTTPDGFPYFVMEYIAGEDLLAYCDSRRLSVADRVRLFRKVCSAVAYAHQRLVVHRDIKPANVLVTAEGVPKLLDFGLAKLLDPDPSGSGADLTATSFHIFTPEYASPEQVRGASVTTSSDVYSLGVVLYRLLTGQSPYRVRSRAPDEISRAVLEQYPTRPSNALSESPERPARLLRGDLDAIVLKALRKEPEGRYTSAEQLAGDLRNYLEGLPVQARKGTFRYRAAKFTGRHRGAIAAAALLLLSLVGGLATSVWQMRDARFERDRAQREASKARQVSAFLRSLFESSSPRRTHGEQITTKDLLGAGAERVNRELADQPEVQASMLVLLGSVYMDLGLVESAQPLVQRSLAIRERLLGPDHPDTAESLAALALIEIGRRNFEAAEALLRRAIPILERSPGRQGLSDALMRLGGTRKALGRIPEARLLMQRAVAIEEERRGPKLHKWLTNLATVELDLGNVDEARRLLQRALEIGLRAEGKPDVELDVTLLDLASVLRAQEDFAGARSLLEQALSIDEKAFGKDSGTISYDLGELGEVFVATHDYARARACLERSVAIAERVYGPDHPAMAAPLLYSGRLLLAEGRPRQALTALERALALRDPHDRASNDYAENLADIGRATSALRGLAAGEEIFRRALAIQRAALPTNHRSLVPTLTSLGRAMLARDETAAARPLLEEAARIAREKLPERHSWRQAAEAALRDLDSAARRPSAYRKNPTTSMIRLTVPDAWSGCIVMSPAAPSGTIALLARV